MAQPPQPVFGSAVGIGHVTRMRRMSDTGSPRHHQVNMAQVNPYGMFTVDQALALPKREKEWRHEMRYEIQKVEDNLFIGPWVACKKMENLLANEITHILAVMQESDVKIMKAARSHDGAPYDYGGRRGNFLYRELVFNDRKFVPVGVHVQTFIQTLEEVRKVGGNLLIYCLQGISQSPTLVIGYLMNARRCMYIEGYRFLHNVRFCIHPNEGFVSQLMELEKLIKAQDQTQAHAVSGGTGGDCKRKAIDDYDEDEDDLAMYE